ncbi:MAG TPA: hypothetical protein DEA63_04905, partial [Firmicutes bacterium]|nr:hypothetical protein [Bacillota bacterium]
GTPKGEAAFSSADSRASPTRFHQPRALYLGLFPLPADSMKNGLIIAFHGKKGKKKEAQASS